MTKKKLVKKFINFLSCNLKNYSLKKICFFYFIFILSACTPQSEKLYTEAYSEIESGHFRIALDLLERSASIEKNDKKKTKAMVEAARIARFEIQDYERAIRINRQIILKSEDSKQRLLAQETLCEIYLENVQNYSQALTELLILEQLTQGAESKEKIRFQIAQAQFLSGNQIAALEYIDASMKNAISYKKNFLKLKAQALLSLKRFDEALSIYEEVKKVDQDFFIKENLFNAVSITYEEKEDYASALAYLEKYKDQISDKAYLELRIKRLKERIINRPLFKGRRK